MEIKWQRRINRKVRMVNVDDKYNLMDNKGNILSPIWFDEIYSLGYGKEYMVAYLINEEGKRQYNILDLKGNLLSENLWFDGINNYIDFNDNGGFGVVELNNKFNFIDCNGKLLSNDWFDKYTRFNDKGFTFIEIDNVPYRLDNKGVKEQVPYYNFFI